MTPELPGGEPQTSPDTPKPRTILLSLSSVSASVSSGDALTAEASAAPPKSRNIHKEDT